MLLFYAFLPVNSLARYQDLGDGLHLAGMVKGVDAGEEEPFAPVHLAEFVVTPQDVEMGGRVCLQH